MSSTPGVCVVTGGLGGLGSAVAASLAAEGWHVARADVAHPDPEAECNGMFDVDCDVTSTSSVRTAFARVVRQWDRIDLLVNAAGIARPQPSADIDDVAWQEMLDIHVTGTMRCCREAYPYLRLAAGANIVNFSSMNSRLGVSGRLSYCAAKAAIEAMTRVLAVEWAADDIRVNAVAPGYIETDMLSKLIADGDHDPAALLRRVPAGRLGKVADVSGLVAFLASPAAAYVTGHTLFADGGRTVNGDL
jgi:NAD(P)-dependent dehydrogenase (short-subunit alcohol dehydrogenase family)